MGLDVRQMRAFCAVARTGGFTTAARELHLTQSAVSMLVQKMEHRLGVLLFDRGHATTTLTSAGHRLQPLVEHILEDLRQVEEGASDLRQLRSGSLRLVASQMLACTWLAPVLAEFSHRHPSIALRMVDANADDVVNRVRHGDAEIGIGPERPTGDDVEGQMLMRVPIRLMCAQNHPLASRRSVAWKDLSTERWVVYSSEFNRELERAMHAHSGLDTMLTASQAGYLTTALALVGAGTGIIAVPDYVRAFAEHFGLAVLQLHNPSMERAFFTYQRRDRVLSPTAQVFMDALQIKAHAPQT